MEQATGKSALTGVLCALGCETLFGLSYLFTRQAVNYGGEFALLGWRFFIAALVMSLCAATGLIRINLKGKPLGPLLAVALCNPCLYFIAETVGIGHTTASESGVFLACIPVASLVASTLMLKKRPTRMQIAGILITLSGVLITVLAVGAASGLSATGYAFLLVAVLAYALYSVYVDRASAYTGAEITYAMLLLGGALFVGIALIKAACRGTLPRLLSLPLRERGFLAAILYQGIGCSVLAFFLSNVAIARMGVNRTASFIGIATVVSILAGALLLGESFTPWQLAGAAVILAGVYAANLRG